MMLIQISGTPVGSNPTPVWLHIILITIFLFFGLSFSSYILIIYSDFLAVGFPVYKVKIPWEKIEGVEIENKSLWKYGGYGIRITKINEKKALIVAIPRTKILKLKMNGGKWGYVLISTNNPDTTMGYIKQETELHKKK